MEKRTNIEQPRQGVKRVGEKPDLFWTECSFWRPIFSCHVLRFNNKIALSGVLQDYLEDTRGKNKEHLKPSGRAAGSHFCRPGFARVSNS